MHIYSHSELSGERVLANQMRHSWKRLRFSENKPTEMENRAQEAVVLSAPPGGATLSAETTGRAAGSPGEADLREAAGSPGEAVPT